MYIINVLQTAQRCVYNQSVYTHGRPCDVRLPFDYTDGPKIIKHATLLFLSFFNKRNVCRGAVAGFVGGPVFPFSGFLPIC